MHYIPPVYVQPEDQYLVNSNLDFLSDFYGIGIDIKLRETTGIPGKENLIISLCRVFSEEVRNEYIAIENFRENTEGKTILDPLFNEIFITLKGIDRDALLEEAKKQHRL
jgi:hypothetical protein